MKHIQKQILSIWAIAFLALSVFAVNAKDGDWDWDSEAQRRKAEYVFMESMRQDALGNSDSYYELMRYAYDLDKTNGYTGFYIGYYDMVLGNNDSILFSNGYELMKDYFKQAPENLYTSYHFGNINEKLGMPHSARKVWAALDSVYPDKTEVGMKYAEILSRSADSADRAQGMTIYNRIERAEGKSIAISTQKMRNLMVSNDTVSVINELHELLSSSPKSAEYNVFAGEIYSMFNQPDSALHYLNHACQLDSTSGLVYYARANFYKNQGDSVAYDREVFQALKQENLDLQSKLSLLTNYIRALYEDPEQQPRIQNLFAVLLDQHPHEKEIHELYCAYLVAIKDYKSAAEQAGYIVDIEPSDEIRWRQLMSLQAQTNDYPKAIETGKNALHYHPQSTIIHLLIGADYNSIGQPDTAITYFHKAYSTSADDDFETRSSIMGSIGDSYYMMEQNDSAFAYYDRALDLNPGNLLAMNNLAYYLAEQNLDLDRAERLSTVTVQEEPENANSLDTYAWILFKKKDYERALHYINEALKHSENPSVEVYHHAGDIYFMAGDPDKAVEYWEKALEIDGSDELLQRKVKHQTYFYK